MTKYSRKFKNSLGMFVSCSVSSVNIIFSMTKCFLSDFVLPLSSSLTMFQYYKQTWYGATSCSETSHGCQMQEFVLKKLEKELSDLMVRISPASEFFKGAATQSLHCEFFCYFSQLDIIHSGTIFFSIGQKSSICVLY